MLKTIQDKARHRTRPLWAWLKLLWQRIDEDNMTTLAGNLAYVSLLSLVPLVAVVFALFAAFPMFSDVSQSGVLSGWKNNVYPDIYSCGSFICY